MLADIPSVTDSAGVWEGCLDSSSLPLAAAKIGMPETGLASTLAAQGLTFGELDACIRFVAVTGGQSGVASAAFRKASEEDNDCAALVIRNTANKESTAVTPDCPESRSRSFEGSLTDIGDLNSAFMAGLPENARWEIGTLARAMIEPLLMRPQGPQLPQAVEDPAEDAGSAVGNKAGRSSEFLVRVALGSHPGTDKAYLESLEIVEQDTGRLVDGAWWLQRSDGSGVFIGTKGIFYERLFWQSPVEYKRLSRGLMQTRMTVRSRAAVANSGQSGGKPPVRTTQVRVFHGGVDMTAPRGSEVHAVADGKVLFAGRRGGFGNLVILDHGSGYCTYYAHLSKIESNVREGAASSRGEIIGLVGSTGRATGPHLHFEVRKDGKYIDPFDNSKEPEFWLLSAEDQQRLAVRLLDVPARGDSGGFVASIQ
jgi:murein DD-endopeptidase MepM/ murein hydrolase activator NlpD